ncbi:MAG: AAA family ATPase [Methanomicrobia archaeon]|nr:AAA family ATPase [Methanomicrobia archaeon]
MLTINTSTITTIAGMRGSGKTTLAREILRQIKGDKIVYDPMHEYNKKISFRPKSDSLKSFDGFLKWAWKRGNIFICIDEAERYFPLKKTMLQYAFKTVNTGRHRNIGLLVITRRIAELHKTVFGLSNTIILFQMFLPNDIRYLLEFFPDAEKLRHIPKFQYEIFTM